MKISIDPPIHFCEQGKRTNNEDYVYPLSLDVQETVSQVFLVCDGVGGCSKGEVASKITCETIWKELSSHQNISEEDIKASIELSIENIKTFEASNEESKGMATTLTLLAIHEKGITIAHVGDSRIYHFRNGNIVRMTSDHSLVNEMVEQQIITEQEAIDHPKRNVVTRAISSGNGNSKAVVTLITDVRDGDYFFLCSDGVLETMTDLALSSLFGNELLNDEQKKEEIVRHCNINSRDNFSGYIIPIKSVEKNTWEMIKSAF